MLAQKQIDLPTVETIKQILSGEKQAGWCQQNQNRYLPKQDVHMQRTTVSFSD